MNLETILILAFPVTYLFMYTLEKRYPARDFPKIKWWGVVGVGFMAIMISVGVITPLFLPVDWLAAHRWMDGTRLGIWKGVLLGFVVVELGVYIFHRSCHNVGFMWRAFHQMHHGAERLDIPGAVIFHPFELLAQNVISIGITVLILGLEPVAGAIIGYLVTFCSLFQHWNIKTPRWIGYIIQRPEAHCLHHEVTVHAYNYADLAILDILFGTFKNPADFEGRVGFGQKASFKKMLVGVDVSQGQVNRQPAFGSSKPNPL